MSTVGRKRVSVTITPRGLVTDVAIDGHSVAGAMPAGGAELTLAHGDLPQLRLVLVPDEITVKGATDGPHA